MADVTETPRDEPTDYDLALRRLREETRERAGRKASLDEIVELIRSDRDAASR
jgi:hypothetical protein